MSLDCIAAAVATLESRSSSPAAAAPSEPSTRPTLPVAPRTVSCASITETHESGSTKDGVLSLTSGSMTRPSPTHRLPHPSRDVYFGAMDWPGNYALTALIYSGASAQEIIQDVTKAGGRFLVNSGNCWVYLSNPLEVVQAYRNEFLRRQQQQPQEHQQSNHLDSHLQQSSLHQNQPYCGNASRHFRHLAAPNSVPHRHQPNYPIYGSPSYEIRRQYDPVIPSEANFNKEEEASNRIHRVSPTTSETSLTETQQHVKPYDYHDSLPCRDQNKPTVHKRAKKATAKAKRFETFQLLCQSKQESIIATNKHVSAVCVKDTTTSTAPSTSDAITYKPLSSDAQFYAPPMTKPPAAPPAAMAVAGRQDSMLPRGVTVRPSGKWQAQIYFAGQSRYLGLFQSKEAAGRAFEVASNYLAHIRRHGKLHPEQADEAFASARKLVQDAVAAIPEE